MKYNFKKIGNRIREERKKLKWSQADLITHLQDHNIYIGRNTLSAIENGDVENSQGCFKMIPALCELFD